jgi:hypothetical protein
MMRATTARSQPPVPNRASLAASRATTTTCGLTGASAGAHASRRAESSVVTRPPAAHAPTTATTVATSPIMTAFRRPPFSAVIDAPI